MPNKSKFEFALRNISTGQFAILEENFKEGNPIQQKVALSFDYTIPERRIGIAVKVSLGHEEKPFMLIEASCHYEILKQSWNAFKQQDQLTYILPKQHLRQLVYITVLTVRGILHGKTDGTPFNRFFIQSFSIPELIDEDLIMTAEA